MCCRNNFIIIFALDNGLIIMNIERLERILLEQKEEIELQREAIFCRRREENLIDLGSNLAQVVIGVRRSGKSTLCFNALEHAGVKYAYVNFDDERLVELNLSDFDTVLELLYKIYGDFTHLFLDEIQNIDGWHLFANRMLRKKVHLLITGSNSRLLSGELASHLTGRHHPIELYPFSFSDFCNISNVQTSPLTTKNRGLVAAAFERYLKQGGFPELMNEKDHKSYVDNLVNNIIEQDIKHRFGIRYSDTLRRLANHLLNEVPTFLVKDKLLTLFNIGSRHTLGNYLSYLNQTYLLSFVSKYTAKSRLRTRNEKMYAIDVAFMNQRADAFSGENYGWRLETIVYLELRRRCRSLSQDVYYYNEGGAECDFIVCDGNRAIAAYQVAMNIASAKTRRREIKGCIAASVATKCEKLYILTTNESETITTEGCPNIVVMPTWEWLIKSDLGV